MLGVAWWIALVFVLVMIVQADTMPDFMLGVVKVIGVLLFFAAFFLAYLRG